jgi:DNA polymerase-3 subunit delta
MSHTVHIFDYLDSPAEYPLAGVCVLFGDEPFLKQLGRGALRKQLWGEASDDTPLATFVGDEARWRDVLDELSTVSLFGGGGAKRLAIVENADKFVSQNRQSLEDYAAKPSRIGTLVLEVDAWPGNTKLYKIVDKEGLQIDCRPPEIARGRNKVPDGERIEKWLRAWATSHHNIALEARGASLLLELAGPVFGILDQDLAKLALYVKPGGKVTAEMVREIVGGWRAKTAWDMVDAACDGDAAEALLQLDRLLQSGDHPIAIFGQISWSMRRYNTAVRVYEAAERAGRRISLRESLQQAGFNDWPKGTLDAAEGRLKQLGRERAGKLYRWLLEIDLALKGTHSHDDRARFALEHLFLRMAKAPGKEPLGKKAT